MWVPFPRSSGPRSKSHSALPVVAKAASWPWVGPAHWKMNPTGCPGVWTRWLKGLREKGTEWMLVQRSPGEAGGSMCWIDCAAKLHKQAAACPGAFQVVTHVHETEPSCILHTAHEWHNQHAPLGVHGSTEQEDACTTVLWLTSRQDSLDPPGLSSYSPRSYPEQNCDEPTRDPYTQELFFPAFHSQTQACAQVR